jgi:2'-5' RNA ligase/endonuclease/exonuclease/phosphatase family metal-dependent hydrolase
VHPSALNDAASRLRSALHAVSHEPFTLNLDHVGQFSNRSYNTVYLAPSSHATAQIQSVFKTISIASGYKGRPFVPHATIGQARSDREMSLLQEKGALMLRNHNLSWDLGSVVILSKDEADGGKMKIYEEIPLKEGSVLLAKIISDRPLTFTAVDGGWTPATMSDIPSLPNARLRVISMNILHDDTHAPRLRFDLLKRVMLSHTPHLLCLQEVPDDFLPLLLSDPDIQSRYRYSTCGSSSVLPNLQNIVALSSLPFTWESLVLNDKHKAASILTFAFSRPLIVVVIHFTAGHTPPRQAKREVEAAALLAHLRTHHAGTEWIIVGDMNLDTDSLPVSWPDMDDAWTLCHPGQSGETYDPIRNALAADTVREVKTAFRYDRLCVQKGSSIQVERVDIVKAAADERPASDHWALFSELDMSSLLDASRFTNHPTLAERITVDGGGGGSISLGADAVLEAWARANGGYPSHDQEVARTRAIQTIRQVLGGASSNSTDVSYPASAPLPSGVKVILEPVGSHMLSVDTAASDIDMLAVGNLGQRTFFDLMRARIRAWARACAAARVPCTLVLRRFVRDAAVPMLRLQVHGVEVDLQYAPAAMVAERWVEVPNLSSEDSLFSLPAPTLRVLNAYRDSQRILALLSNERLPSFRLALRALKLFIAARGLSGAKFGFLGGIHLTLLLARVALSDAPDDTFTASEMLSTFISRYAHFPFTEEIVAIEGVAVGSTYRRTPREALAILSVERPLINVAAGATVPNVAAIQEEFVRADALLHTANESWAAICGTPGDSAQTFMSGYPAYVKVDLSFWGVDATRMRALLGYVESRLVKVWLFFWSVFPVY